MEIVFVGAEMISKSVNPLGEESNLHLGRTGIIIMRAELGDDGLFLFGLKRHTYPGTLEKHDCGHKKTALSLSTQPEEYSIRPEILVAGSRSSRPGTGVCLIEVTIRGITLAC